MGEIRWYKSNEFDKVWWEYNPEIIGKLIFSFDKKEKFNFWTDYPHKLTSEQKAIFDKENPDLISLKA